MSPRRDRKLETTTREKSPEKNGFSTSELLIAGFGRLGGGRSRARTWDPLISAPSQTNTGFGGTLATCGTLMSDSLSAAMPGAMDLNAPIWS